MLGDLWTEVGSRGIGVLAGMLLGGGVTWFIAAWRRRKERLRISSGDARDTISIHLHLIETSQVTTPTGTRTIPTALRVRALGQSELCRVVPNGHLASVLMRRAQSVTARDPLISMEGHEGSFLLETLTNFVCDRVANAPFDHELYIMAPACESAEMAEHQPITILLISVENLKLFENWVDVRGVRVEHGSDGARLLTLMDLCRRHREESAALAELRKAGKRTRYVETMYTLDLALDRRTATVPTKAVPWGRYETILKELDLE